MKRLRTLVVVHSTLVPPDSLEGHSEKEIEEWRTEYDVVSTLKNSDHEVRCLGISDSLEELRAVITEWKPEIVFNLLEEFDGIVTYDQHVVAFLELLVSRTPVVTRAGCCSRATNRCPSSFCPTTAFRHRNLRFFDAE